MTELTPVEAAEQVTAFLDALDQHLADYPTAVREAGYIATPTWADVALTAPMLRALTALVRPELESSYAVLLESNDLRDKARAEAEQLRARLDLVKAALGEIEKRARQEEQTGIAAAYCALWDAHGLIQDALNAEMP